MAHGFVYSHYKTNDFVLHCDIETNRPDNFADHMVDEKIAISEYSLSASVACGKVRRRYHLILVRPLMNACDGNSSVVLWKIIGIL